MRPPREELLRRLAAARANLRACTLCAYRCAVDRTAGAAGICRTSDRTRVFRELLHFGEELDLIPSHVVYLNGCNFGCVFCISGVENDIVEVGEPLEAEAFARRILARRDEGARNVNFLGGEPSIHAHAILELALHLPPDFPIVLNTNLYLSAEGFALLRDVVDIYLADFKFGNQACAERLAGVEDYLPVVRRNLRKAAGAGRLIVRHLVMPAHVDCCTLPCLDWLAAELPTVELSLMDQYVPMHRAVELPDLGRMATAGEEGRARAYARERGLRLVE